MTFTSSTVARGSIRLGLLLGIRPPGTGLSSVTYRVTTASSNTGSPNKVCETRDRATDPEAMLLSASDRGPHRCLRGRTGVRDTYPILEGRIRSRERS